MGAAQPTTGKLRTVYAALLWLVVLFFPRALHADVDLTRWVHEQWRTDRGLPQNSVFCITQDPQGFLWFGTEAGLVRYDGVGFTTLNQRTVPKLKHNFISSILWARTGVLWAGTRTGGLVCYRDNSFLQVPDLSSEHIFSLAETSDGAIWAGTDEGLARVDSGSLKVTFLQEGLPHRQVTALATGRDGQLWIGCANGEILKLESGILKVFPNQPLGRGSSVTGLGEDPATGELWIARDGDGLHKFDGKAITRVELLGHDVENLQTLRIDREGAVWVGSQNDGIIRYKGGDACVLNAQNGLENDNIISVFEDSEGSIWAGTLFGGLHRLNRGAATTLSGSGGFGSAYVTCVVEKAPGVLWLGTRTNGLFEYSNERFRRLEQPSGPREVRAMLQDRDGDIWIGGKEGLVRTKGVEGVWLSRTNGLAANDVSALYQMRSGEIWVGTQRAGITILDPKFNRVVRKLTNDFLCRHVRCLAEDNDGTIWIGTQYGLVRYRDNAFSPRFLSRFKEASIRGLYVDPQNTLWVATRDDGLLRLSKAGLFAFGPDSGLAHSRIYQLLPVGDRLWMGGNLGIEFARFDDLTAVAEGRQAQIFSQLLTERDGLRTVECGGDTTPSAVAGSDGVLWFGTKRGLAMVEPERITRVTPCPPVIITNLRLDKNVVKPAEFSRVPAGTTRLQVSYAAVSLREGRDLSYRYKLIGVDKGWIEAGSDREAVYYHLKPGNYTFSVAASRNNRDWTETKAALAFAVEPRFYQTAWFFWGAFAAGLGTIRGVYRWRVQMGLNAELENRVQNRTAELRGAYDKLEAELQERERIERELAASEARLRRVVDSGMVGIVFWNRRGLVFDANDTFLNMVGYSREDLEAGKISWLELTPPEHEKLDANALEEIDRTGVCTPFEKEYIRRDGTRFPVLIGGAILTEASDQGVCFVLDISERKASEENIRVLAQTLEARVHERTLELARINQQLAGEVQERKRVAVALSSFSQLGQKLHSAHTEQEAANIIALTAKSLIPHDVCSIELYDRNNQLYRVVPAEPGAVAAGEVRSSISVPIRNGSRVIGVIGLQSSTPDLFNASDANTLQALGDYCGGALDRIHAEEARRETERRFAAFMANAPALSWMKDSELHYVFTNPVFQEFLGLTPDEIEQKTDIDLWPRSTADSIRVNDVQVFESALALETQETLCRADGEERILLTLRFPFTTTGGERFVAGMAIDITEQKRAEETLHRLPQSILEAQEQERRRLARELHDSVNQAIASVKFRIQTAENQICRGDPKWQETCSKSKEMLDRVLQQVRQLSHNLRPGELDDLGLIPAARTAIHEFEARTGIAVGFSASGFEERLEPNLESTLYRIVQEALTNIEKHANATEVEIDLIRNEAGVTLYISDNGLGFDSSERSGGGLGLLHMRERSGLVGGTFDLQTAPGDGVRIRVFVPEKAKETK